MLAEITGGRHAAEARGTASHRWDAEHTGRSPPANDDRPTTPAPATRKKSAIVTAKKPGAWSDAAPTWHRRPEIASAVRRPALLPKKPW